SATRCSAWTTPSGSLPPGGALEAVLATRQAGKVRYIGFTGHKSPAVHLHMLATASAHGFVFDAVQLPLNVLDYHFASFQREVVPLLRQHAIGVLEMKTFGERHVLRSGAASSEEWLRYAMGLPVYVAIVGCDTLPFLEQALARSFRPLTSVQRRCLLARTAAAGSTGEFEPYKTTTDFDPTSRNPRWLSGSAGPFGA
ncbi:MAG: aldo/keto reductase, partial [Candidatus Latescibacterota bacterium]